MFDFYLFCLPVNLAPCFGCVLLRKGNSVYWQNISSKGGLSNPPAVIQPQVKSPLGPVLVTANDEGENNLCSVLKSEVESVADSTQQIGIDQMGVDYKSNYSCREQGQC